MNVTIVETVRAPLHQRIHWSRVFVLAAVIGSWVGIIAAFRAVF
jgi:hypothetical protein